MFPELSKSSCVELKEPIDGKRLEQILVEAGEELGYRVKVEDETETGYKLGSVQMTENYKGTNVKLSKRHVPIMQINMDRRYTKQLYLRHGIGWGFSTRSMIKSYLDAVSRRIDDEQAAE